MTTRLVRISPQEDGTARYSSWSEETEEYQEIKAADAIYLLGTPGTAVEVAVNDRDCPNSHWESSPSIMRLV